MTKEKDAAANAETKDLNCPPFIIHNPIGYGVNVYRPGQEEELRAVLDAENFFALEQLGALSRV